MIARPSVRLLEAAEWVYLRAHGWRREGSDWQPPKGYLFRRRVGYTRGHAVNAQKQLTYNPMHGGKART